MFSVSLRSLVLGYFIGLGEDVSTFKTQDSLKRLNSENPAISPSVKQERYQFCCRTETNIHKVTRACTAGSGLSGAIRCGAVGQGAFVSSAPCLWAVGPV